MLLIGDSVSARLEKLNPVVQRNPGSRVLVLGTSLVQQGSGAIRSATNPAVWNDTRGWMHWASILSGGKIHCPHWYDEDEYDGWVDRVYQGLNAGNSGFQVQQIKGVAAWAIDNIDFDYVVSDLGTNDIAGSTATPQSLLEEVIEVNEDMLAAGKTVFPTTILGRATTVPNYDVGDDARKKVHEFNRLLRSWAYKTPHVECWDWAAKWNARDGQPKAGYSDDGTHMYPLGAYVLGKDFVQFMSDKLPPATARVTGTDDVYDETHSPMGNHLGDIAFFEGTGGSTGASVTGTVATGWEVEVVSSAGTSVAAAVTADPDGGQLQQMTFTRSGSGTDTFRLRTDSANITIPAQRSNDWMIGSLYIEVEDGDAIREVRFYIDDQATGGQQARTMQNNSSENLAFGEDWSGVMITPFMKMVEGSTAIRWRVEVEIDASATGTPIVRVGRAELRNVEDPRATLNWKAPA